MASTRNINYRQRYPLTNALVHAAPHTHGLNRSRWLPDISPHVAFWVLATLNYWPILIGLVPLPTDLILQFPPWDSVRDAPFIRPSHAEIGDLVTAFYPWRAFAADAIRQGVVPLQNPFALMGAPFLANAQSAVFYPLNVLYYLLPMPIAYSFGFILRTALAGQFTYLFARKIGASRLGAFCGGLVFAFCGFTTVWQAQSLGDAALWLPLACYCIVTLTDVPSPPRVAATAMVLAMPLLSGHPETATKVYLVAGAYSVFNLWSYQPFRMSRGPSTILALVTAALLSVSLSAVQTLPTIEWLGQIARSMDTLWGARPPIEILSLITRHVSANPNYAGIAVPEGEAFVGVTALLLVPFSLAGKRKRDAVFFALAGIISLQIVFGIGPLYWLTQNTPVIKGMKNWRLLLVVSMSVAVMTALGVSAITSYLAAPPRQRLTTAWLAILLLPLTLCTIGVAILVVFANAYPHPIPWHSSPLSTAAIAFVSGIVLVLALLRKVRSQMFGVLCLAILVVDLVSFSHGYIPFRSSSELFPPAPLFDFLQKQDWRDSRAAALDMTIGGNFNMIYGIPFVTGYDNPLSSVSEFLGPLGTGGTLIEPLDSDLVIADTGNRLDLASVKYIIVTTYNDKAQLFESRPDRYRRVYSDQSMQVFENLTAMPRAFLVPLGGAELFTDVKLEIDRVTSSEFNPRYSVTVGFPIVLPISQSDNKAAPDKNTVKIEGSHINGLSVVAELSEPSILVFSQAYYPGWRAWMNGIEVEVHRVDYLLTGVVLPPGIHTIDLDYRPDSYIVGATVSLAALGAVVALILLSPVITGSTQSVRQRFFQE